jgi:membrane protein
MVSLTARATSTLDRARRRWPVLDHVLRMQAHYGRVNGSAQAGAITYFAFLSFFPILALAFFAVGYVARVDSSAQDNLVQAIQQVLPGIVGTHPGEITIRSIESAATTVGLIGLAGVIYSGLGWLSGMRSALEVLFEMPRSEYPNFFVGKLRDLVTLVVIGFTLVLSVAVTGAVVGYSGRMVDWVGLGHQLTWLVSGLGVLVGVAANMLLFYTLFRLLARPPTPRRSLWQGALLGALGFEVLKVASSYLLTATKHQQAFQAFGIALILLVWINYFSRIVLYAAAWSHTARAARAAREPESRRVRTATPARASAALVPSSAGAAEAAAPHAVNPRVAFGAGAAAMLGLIAALRRRRR